MDKTERHNKLGRDFATKVMKEVMDNGGDFAEVMVVYESVTLCVLLMNTDMFGMKPSASVSMVEVALHEAIKRFTEKHGAQ